MDGFPQCMAKKPFYIHTYIGLKRYLNVFCYRPFLGSTLSLREILLNGANLSPPIAQTMELCWIPWEFHVKYCNSVKKAVGFFKHLVLGIPRFLYTRLFCCTWNPYEGINHFQLFFYVLLNR